MSSLSPEARNLLEKSRGAAGPTSSQRAAMKSVVLSAVLVPGTATAAAAGAKATGLALGAKVSIALVAIAVGATLTWQLVSPPARAPAVEAPRPAVVIATAPPLALPPPIEPVDKPRAKVIATTLAAPRPLRPEPHPPLPVVAVAPPPPPSIDEATLAREVAALSGAMGAVDTRHYAAALEQLATYRATFPTGALETEAGVVEVLALCGLGRVDEARAAAASLSANNPAVRRLTRSCISAR